MGISHDARLIDEYYEVTGAPKYQNGRRLFFSFQTFDAVIFVYDASDPSTRSSVSCTWVPEVMQHLGDVGAIESGGRLDGTDLHVRTTGVMNELRFLWRQTLFSYASVSIPEAAVDSFRLSVRLVKLWLNDTGLWSDATIDRQAEAAFLSTSTVPAAIIAMKSDLVEQEDDLEREYDTHSRAIPHIRLSKRSITHDARLRAFLKRAADLARRRNAKSINRQQSSGQLMLGFA